MAQLLVRKLDQSVVDALKAKAALHGHSLEQEAREVLTAAVKFTPEERVAFADRIRQQSRWSGAPDSTEIIRHDRDRR
jgi:plasmid stability protein